MAAVAELYAGLSFPSHHHSHTHDELTEDKLAHSPQHLAQRRELFLDLSDEIWNRMEIIFIPPAQCFKVCGMGNYSSQPESCS